MVKHLVKGFLFFFLILTTTLSLAQIQFNEVTDIAGPFDDTESWGASWGDLNGDGYPDLFVNNHRVRPALFRNNGDGTFTDVILTVDTSRIWLDNILADTHAGTWADYDNDGDQDIYNLTGVCCDGIMQVNVNGQFQEKSAELGISADREGRLAGWYDYNKDGLLDVIIQARAPSRLYQQQVDNTFIDRTFLDQMTCLETNFGLPSDIDGDGEMEWVCVDDKNFPQSVLDITTDYKFVDSTYPVPTVSHTADVAIADFNGDLLPDILVVRGRLRPVGGSYIPALNKIEAWLRSETNNQISGFNFVSDGSITVDIDSNQFRGPYQVYIGATGRFPIPAELPFTLDSTDTTVHGFIPDDPNFDPYGDGNQGTYFGFDPLLKVWKVYQAPGIKSARGYYQVQATAPVTDLAFFGTNPSDFPEVPAFLINTGTGFVNEAGSRGLGNPIFCPSLTTGDFDNDMDIDIYMVCRGSVENIANRLYDNQGDGTFIEVAAAGGAEGLIGVGLDSGASTGEGVAYADFDVDGFLDIYVTNGMLMQPFKIGGPDQLFRNTSGDPGMGAENNHWVLLDLLGAGPPSGSNFDGIGAKVYVTAGGVTQLREQNGGYRRWGQNHQRVHFGLAANTQMDIRVEWPNGQVDNFTAVQSNKLYRVNEGGSIDPVVPGSLIDFRPAQSGDECGAPGYNASDDQGGFLWKDCAGDGSWHLRATGGGSPTVVRFEGSVSSTLGFTTMAGFSFDGGELLDTSDPNVAIYRLNVMKIGIDGLDFSIPAGSTTCFRLDLPGNQIYLGATHLPVSTPLDLGTLAACDTGGGAGPDLSISDVSVSESDGSAIFTVTLSTGSSQTVTVDYATSDGTATVVDGDYAATSGTLTFATGEVSKSVAVTIVDDTVTESLESFSMLLSNVTSAQITDGLGVATILDNEASACGEPVFDAATEPGVFLWNDCAGGTGWKMVATGGGSPTGNFYDGTIISSQAFATVTGVSIEANDTLDTTSPLVIDYLLKTWNAGTDGIDFSYPAGSNVCFDMTTAGLPVYVGASRQVLTTPFDLETLSSCVSLSVSDVSVSESDASAVFTVALSSASTQTVTVDFATTDGTATVLDGDYVAASGSLTFATGELSKTVPVSIVDDAIGESSETFTLDLSNSSNALIVDSQGVGTIIDNEVSACGEPVFDAATEPGVFLWNDCAGGTGWKMVATGGGSPTGNFYDGTIISSQAFATVTGVSIEANDTLDTTSPLVIDYLLKTWNAGTDGIDFSYPAGSNVCFDMTTAGLPVYVGASRQVLTTPFDLETLSSCVSLSVSDVSVSESDASAVFTVALSSASTQTVTVDFATTDGTATVLDGDYVAASGSLTFATGELSKTVPVSIVDDAIGESSETFTLDLSNSSNALIVDSQGVGTIIDNEVSACGEPVFDAATEPGVFLWDDCSGGSGWKMVVTGGGSLTSLKYRGTITSSQAFTSVTGISIETSDSLDTTNPLEIIYLLQALKTGFDEVDFLYPSGSNVCFDMTTAGLPVYVGSSRQVIAPPFDLGTLGTCL